MGKYMRKSKTAGEVAIMEASLGVKTRAKTQALQRLKKSAAVPAAAPPSPSTGNACGSYLQLRSRRLEKPAIQSDSKKQRHPLKRSDFSNPNNSGENRNSRASSRLKVGSVNSESVGSVSIICTDKDECGFGAEKKVAGKEEEVKGINGGNHGVDLGIEGSSGENVLEFESRERSARETTPCSLIRDPGTIRTPGSSTKPACSTEANRTIQDSVSDRRRRIPTTHEMNEFFAGAEEEQQKQFIDKYNFDPVNDEPLPGRFEWQKVDP